MRWLFTLLCLTFTAMSYANTTPSLGGSSIDKVLVVKSERRLHLVSAGQTLKSYRVSLGKQPRGAKLREGDMRTPEGFYWIDWRKTSDKYNLSMHISYPNARDLARAQEEGVPPGSMIMITTIAMEKKKKKQRENHPQHLPKKKNLQLKR